METKHQYALVTGATSGIGYELAQIFAQNGYHLITVARNEEELERTAQHFREHGVEVIPMAKDLFNIEQAFEIYEELKRRGISPAVLVNDAGQGLYGKFEHTNLHREIDIINLNITSLVVLTKLFLQDRIPQKSGKILNLASIASKSPGPWHSVYHGTKAFVLSFSEAIREEVKEQGITVTALLPGPTDTDFFNKADMTKSKIMEDKESFSTAAEVASDGYNALMNGEDKVISGFKNKMTVAMSNLSTDSMAAQRMGEMQKPSDEL